ncbi:Inositol monophosphatase 2 [Blyttiomyces sp. JEL0837]|nr:Inositol monophosphatase 2 [Blyttiomyces sp. JEL0837]
MIQELVDVSDLPLQEWLDFAIEVAKKAGQTIKSAFEDTTLRGNSEYKSNNASDIVTATDRAVESQVFADLRTKFPNHRFIGEESFDHGEVGSGLTDELTWVVDPVDGTTNFVHGLPFVAVSIALLKQKTPILGIVHNPILNELFTATLHNGSHLNNIKLPHPRYLPLQSVPSLATAFLATEYGYERDQRLDSKLDTLTSVLKSPARTVRSLGSAALEACYVAKGTFDSYWEAGVHMWDISAAAIILRESGGRLVNFDKQELMVNKKEGIVNEEWLDVSCRKFIAVRAMPGGFDEVMKCVEMLRAHLRPLEYDRD